MKNHKLNKFLIFLTVTFASSIILSFLYCFLTFRDGIVVYDNKISNVQSNVIVKLPRLDTYLVKLWGDKCPEKIYFNNVEVAPFRVSTRNNTVEVYIKFDRSLVNERRNIINIIGQSNYSMRIKNFYGLDDSKTLFVLFDSSVFLSFDTPLFFNLIFLIFGVFLAVFSLVYFFTKLLFFNLNFFKLFLTFILGNSLSLAVALTLIFILKINHYRIILLESLFLRIAYFYICVLATISFCIFLFIYRHKIGLNLKISLLLSKIVKVPIGERKNVDFFLEYLWLKIKASPYAFLIRLSILGLISCLFCVLLSLYFLSEIISYFSFFCLFVCFILKLNSLRRDPPSE